MRMVTLPGGETVPALGQGTWRMGERGGDRQAQADALKAGLDLGLTLIDTAEMYGEGGAEEVVAEAIAGRRDEVFVVSKVYPHNASRTKAIAACERSLARLGTDCIDLYLLHWRGSYPLSETIAAFETLKADGKIRYWGVSNFDAAGIDEVQNLAEAGACAANQVLYHLHERGIEWELIPRCRRDGIAVMAYTPLGEGRLLEDPCVVEIARRHGVAPSAVALAWVLRHDGMIAIPKAAHLEHLQANAAAADLVLDADDIARLDAAFPQPSGPTPLMMI